MAVPVSTIIWRITCYSSCEPAHQCTPSGWQSWATSPTHALSCLCVVRAFFSVVVSTSTVRLDIKTLSFLLVESRASPPGRTGETPVPPSYDYHAVAVPAGASNRGFDFRHDAFQVLESLIDGKRIHFATQTFPRFQRRFQKEAADFLCQRTGHYHSTSVIVFTLF